MEGWREGGQAEQSATHLYLRLSVTFRGAVVAVEVVVGLLRCKTQVGAKKCVAKSHAETKGRLVAKRKNAERQRTDHRVKQTSYFDLELFHKKQLFSSLAFLPKRGDSNANPPSHSRHPPTPPRCGKQIRFSVDFMESPHAKGVRCDVVVTGNKRNKKIQKTSGRRLPLSQKESDFEL